MIYVYYIFLAKYPFSAESVGCFEWNTNFDRNDINAFEDDENYFAGSGKRNSKYECQQLCQATTGCAFFTYNPQMQFCHLKTSDNGRIYLKGVVSGPKFCGN